MWKFQRSWRNFLPSCLNEELGITHTYFLLLFCLTIESHFVQVFVSYQSKFFLNSVLSMPSACDNSFLKRARNITLYLLYLLARLINCLPYKVPKISFGLSYTHYHFFHCTPKIIIKFSSIDRY